MIPILYESNEINFKTNGIGPLSDAETCFVTEEKNGSYELEMEYPINGRHFLELKAGRFIYAEPAYMRDPQPFEIYKKTDPLDGVSTIYARHISYRASYVPILQFYTDGDAAQAMRMLDVRKAEDHPFTLYTDVVNNPSGVFEEKEPGSLRKYLGDISEYYGGEYEWDKYNIRLLASRGKDTGFEIRYGKNLTDFKQEANIEACYTGICPYWKGSVDGNDIVVNLDSKVIMIEGYDKFPYHRIQSVDVSSYVELPDNVTAPDQAMLQTAANKYIEEHKNEYCSPEVNITVSFINLSDTLEYKDYAPLEQLHLCDTITVCFDKLEVKTKAKIVKTVWNVLTERYKSIQIGSVKSDLASSMAAQSRKIEEVPSANFLTEAINSATNLITGNIGGYVKLNRDLSGNPYELLIMDTDNIATARNVWRFNKSGWGHSSTGYNGSYTLAATQDGKLVADMITTGTLRSINITGVDFNNGNGTFHVDANGNLTASSANIRGVVNATSGQFQGSVYASDGKIGPWTFNPEAFYNGKGIGEAGSCGISNIPGWAHWAGNGNFRVDENGYLYCNNANITGEIHATSGSFSGDIATGNIHATGGTIENLTCRNLHLDSLNGCSVNAGAITGTVNTTVVSSINSISMDYNEFTSNNKKFIELGVRIKYTTKTLELFNAAIKSSNNEKDTGMVIIPIGGTTPV